MTVARPAHDLAQEGDPVSGGGGFWSTLIEALAREPAIIQLLVMVVLGLLVALVIARMRRAAREASSRRAVEDFLFAVELSAHGDAREAKRRLESVLRAEPDNLEAHLLHGAVLSELGLHAEAHKVHNRLELGFGIGNLRNQLGIARSLLAVGALGEAVGEAHKAVEMQPDSLEAWRLLLQAQLASGWHEDAAQSAAELARLELDPEARRRAAAIAEQLTAAADRSAVAVAGVAESGAWRLPDAWECVSCGLGLPTPVQVCPYCGSREPPRPREAAWVAPLESVGETLDAIEENDAHIRRLVVAATGPATEMSSSAFEDLVDLGERAVPFVLAEAIRMTGAAERAVAILHRMGPSVLPTLFAAWTDARSLKAGRGVVAVARRALGDQRATEVMGRVVQGFDASAREAFESLLDTGDRDLRKILIDYFLGLGAPDEIEDVLARFPAVELVHRLNAASDGVLHRLLGSARGGGYFVESLLVEPGFEREAAVLDVLEDAVDADALVRALERRGPSRRLLGPLIDALGHPGRTAYAHRLLDQLADSGVDVQLAEFYDLDRSEAIRDALRRRLIALGPRIVPSLCNGCIGAVPTPLDDDFVRLLEGIGAPAVVPLVAAYRAVGIRERLRIVSRYTHRRVMIIRALGAIGGRDVQLALAELRRLERDPALMLRLAEALSHTSPRLPPPVEDPEQEAL